MRCSSASWRSPALETTRSASRRAMSAVVGSTANSSSAASRGSRSRRSGSSRNTSSPTTRSWRASMSPSPPCRSVTVASSQADGDRVGGEVAAGEVLRQRAVQRREVDVAALVHDAPGAVALRQRKRRAAALARVRPGGCAGITRDDDVPVIDRPAEQVVADGAADDPALVADERPAAGGELLEAHAATSRSTAVGPVAQSAGDLVADGAGRAGERLDGRTGPDQRHLVALADAQVVGQDHRQLVHRHGADRARPARDDDLGRARRRTREAVGVAHRHVRHPQRAFGPDAPPVAARLAGRQRANHPHLARPGEHRREAVGRRVLVAGARCRTARCRSGPCRTGHPRGTGHHRSSRGDAGTAGTGRRARGTA